MGKIRRSKPSRAEKAAHRVAVKAAIDGFKGELAPGDMLPDDIELAGGLGGDREEAARLVRYMKARAEIDRRFRLRLK